MIVYITTNTINGRKYIGQSINNNNTYYKGSGKILSSAIKKYGSKNFVKEILAYAKDKQDLDDLEMYYIDYYNACKSDLFYNISPGGTGGIVWSSDKCPRCEKIYEVDINNKQVVREFESGRHASIFYNISFKNISAVLNKRKKSVSGKVFVKEKDYKDINWDFYIIKDKRFEYTVIKSGEKYFDIMELHKKEYPEVSIHSFKIYFPKYIKRGDIIKSKNPLKVNQ